MAPEVPVAAAPALPIPVPVRGNDDLDPAPSAREWLTGIHSLANNEPPDPPSKAEAWINVQAEPVSENLNPALGDSRCGVRALSVTCGCNTVRPRLDNRSVA